MEKSVLSETERGMRAVYEDSRGKGVVCVVVELWMWWGEWGNAIVKSTERGVKCAETER
jgi:hypothetical protein